MNNRMSDASNFLELNGLNNIRMQSYENDKQSKDAALKQAAQQFEAIFMQMLLKSMRSAQDVLESDSPFNSQSTKFYRDMHDQQLAVELSTNGTLGLADLIERQLGGAKDGFRPASVLRNDGTLSSRPASSTSTNDIFPHLKESIEAPNNRQSEQEMELPLAPQPSVAPVSFASPKDFVTALEAPAKQVQSQLNIPFEVVIAQAALETGWGKKIIQTEQGQSSNNLFNIKADHRWQGDKTQKETLEYEQGSMVKRKEPFRVYDSLNDSVNDFVSFLSSGERYQKALKQTDNVEQFLHGLQKAGYATDPNYANKIMGTLKTVTKLLVE